MPSPQIDSYNVRWHTPSANAGESMPCGGGDIGVNVWVENGDLLIYLSRSGTFDELNRMPKLGRVRVRLEPNPFAPDARFCQELRLRQGHVLITADGNDQRAQIDVWVDVFRPAVHIEAYSSIPAIATATYESWRFEDREFRKEEIHSARSWAGAPEKGVVRRDEVDFAEHCVRFMHRNQGRTAFDLTVEQQGLTTVRDRLWNPLHNLTFGGSLRGQNMLPAGTVEGIYASTPFRGWKLVSSAPAQHHSICAVLHVDQTESVDDWRRGLASIESDISQSVGSARLDTEKWWNDFWNRSHVAINPRNADPSSEPWQVGRNYQVFRYQLGCNAYGKHPTKFNGGLFTYDPEFVDEKKPLSPDFRQWGGGSFTAQNQRLVYWPMLKSGDVDLMKSQFDFYLNALSNAELRSEVYWNIQGACFVEQIENSGLCVTYEYGWKRKPEVPPGVEDNAWVSYQWDTVFEFCQMILDTHFYTGADIRAYLPLIESCLAFYDSYYTRDGKLTISPGTACETYKNAINPASTIAALRGTLTSLLQLPHGWVGDLPRWRNMLARMPALTYREKDGRRTISPAWEWSHKQNCELPQLYPVYPWGQFGVGRPDLDVAINTWKHGTDAPDQKQIVSWHQDAIFCARLGLTDEARDLTIAKMKDAPRRFPTFWGPGHDWVPDHNWGGSGMIGVQEMLLQAVDEKIYLFPAWPREWDVDFKLHAPANTTIECTFANGRIEHLKVTPTARRADLILPDDLVQ